MRRVQIVYFDAGGGHRSAARALVEGVRLGGWPWQVETINLDELLEPVDLVQMATGSTGSEWYNWSLRRGWTAAPTRLMPAVRGYIRAMLPQHVRLLRKHWRQSAPDLVVSVMPHYNRAIFESLRLERPATPMATILTDLADCPPHFWFELQDQHFICGTPLAVQQARSLGISSDRVIRVSGMIVHPRFYERPELDRGRERRRLGLQPGTPTALIMFGGYGSAQMLRIARALKTARTPLQAIFVCGNNDALLATLKTIKLPFPTHIAGFTTEVDRLMRLSDVFIGKPGPGSVSEAIAAGLPVVVQESSATMPQERHTVDWIRQTDIGVVLPSFAQVAPALEDLLARDTYKRIRANVLRVGNRAVFEIPPILDRIMTEPSSPTVSYGAVAI